MIQIIELTKRYGERVAVDSLSFTLKKGERFGLLGPNGAGKTSTIAMIVGVAAITSGRVEIDGRQITGEVDAHKKRIGYVPQELALYDELSAIDNLRLFGALYGLSGKDLEQRTAEQLESVGLADRAKNPVRTFSGGMKRRLNIAAALLHRPELLILDEPTTGVDPQSRNAIFEKIEQLAAAGMTLLYTTHYMEEVERLCDRIAIMDKGRIIADGTLAELRMQLPESATRLHVDIPILAESDAANLTAALTATQGVQGVELRGEAAEITLTEPAIAPLVLAIFTQCGVPYYGLSTLRPTLETVFLHLTGRSLRDA